MTRAFLLACLLSSASVQAGSWQSPGIPTVPSREQTTSPKPPTVQPGDEESPPEEDESVAPEKFPLNPLESERNLRVGNYYLHHKKFLAAAKRYERATKYNPSSPEAFFKLGEVEEKLKNKTVAHSCFLKVMQLAPDSKLGAEARKKIGSKG